MSCKCNTGGIDYENSVNAKTSDYRTSTIIGTKYTPLITQEFYKAPISTFRNARYLGLEQDIYKTNMAVNFVPKCARWYDHGRAGCADHLRNVHYMNTLKEKMFKDPIQPPPYSITNYKHEFNLKKELEAIEEIPNLKSEAICNLSSADKSFQPRIQIEDNGVMRLLDPYATTSQLTYVPFSLNRKEISRKKILTFYEQKNCPELKMSNIRKPVMDEVVFKKPIYNRITPKLVYRVPFTGKTSEYMHNFRPQTVCTRN